MVTATPSFTSTVETCPAIFDFRSTFSRGWMRPVSSTSTSSARRCTVTTSAGSSGAGVARLRPAMNTTPSTTARPKTAQIHRLREEAMRGFMRRLPSR